MDRLQALKTLIINRTLDTTMLGPLKIDFEIFLALAQKTEEQHERAIDRLIQKEKNSYMALKIGHRINDRFKKYSVSFFKETFGSACCETCGQKIPNPYTQAWLAGQIDVSKATLCHILQGNRLPTLEQLIKITILLDCTIDDLIIDVKELFISIKANS
jgi:DNA-binding XRE family transcriptional regulator